MNRVAVFFVTLLLATLVVGSAAQACTTLGVTAKNGAVIIGRTMEFGVDVKSQALVIPAGSQMESSLPNGMKGMSYKTKYSMVGANAFGLNELVDGINEKGLYVGEFYFPGYAQYATITSENAARAMASYELTNWILGNFSTVAEVKAHIHDIVLAGTVLKEIGGPVPVHFLVRDQSGESLVIEPTDGKLKVFDNPVGVLTNSPTFDWHMTNLTQYIGLRAENRGSRIVGGKLKLSQFGQGTGMIGLPGDMTPPSRFVRAVAYSQTAKPVDNAADGVPQMFHIMNNFDIPLGSVRDKQGNAVHMDYTVWTSVVDLKNGRWYFRTYKDQAIRMIDLNEAVAAAKGKISIIPMDSEQKITNVSAQTVSLTSEGHTPPSSNDKD